MRRALMCPIMARLQPTISCFWGCQWSLRHDFLPSLRSLWVGQIAIL
jgi:hypothetical protein